MLEKLAENLGLGSLLKALTDAVGRYEVLDHWKQGEFHHDLVIRVPAVDNPLPGPILIVTTNCTGGVKELSCFATVPAHDALWHERCPDNAEFSGELPPLLARQRTVHWIAPDALLAPDAPSEYKPEFRVRQHGGGWIPKGLHVNPVPELPSRGRVRRLA